MRPVQGPLKIVTPVHNSIDLRNLVRRLMTMKLRGEIDARDLSALNGSCSVLLKSLSLMSDEQRDMRIAALEERVDKFRQRARDARKKAKKQVKQAKKKTTGKVNNETAKG